MGTAALEAIAESSWVDRRFGLSLLVSLGDIGTLLICPSNESVRPPVGRKPQEEVTNIMKIEIRTLEKIETTALIRGCGCGCVDC
ncbi:MAG: hypothetical protein ACRC0L_08695 [Angustibacter sp.]